MVLIMLDGAVNQVLSNQRSSSTPFIFTNLFVIQVELRARAILTYGKCGQGNYPRYKRLFRNRTR